MGAARECSGHGGAGRVGAFEAVAPACDIRHVVCAWCESRCVCVIHRDNASDASRCLLLYWVHAQKNFREQCTAWRVPSRSQRGPVVRQLGNGRAVSGVGRLIRQSLRSTRAHARASIRAHAPTVHTPAHISMILHKHDTSTFLHLQADMLTSQRRKRARRTSQGTMRRGAVAHARLASRALALIVWLKLCECCYACEALRARARPDFSGTMVPRAGISRAEGASPTLVDTDDQ